MRILVADQNALLLAAIAATFGRHCEIVTATRRDACMEHMEQRHFDVVVACEKLADYTGLELLSEVEAASPPTLRIFAARPETLKRLGTRLDFFGLLGTLAYPIEARKLLLALKVARGRLPGRAKPPPVRHVVLENEWDTGERLALLGQELEDAPVVPAVEHARQIAEASSFEVSFEVSFDENPTLVGISSNEPFEETPAPAGTPVADTQPYFDEGAANDEVFSDEAATRPSKPPAEAPKLAASKPQATKPGAAKQTDSKPGPARPSGAKGPRPRQPTVPTAAHREAFQRALARRNAARAGGIQPPPIDFSAVESMSVTRTAPTAAGSSQSLSDLARVATTKRPLPGARRGSQPKRRVFVVGSGIAAVLLLAVLSFELLRTSPSNDHGRHGRAASAQLFSPRSTLVADDSASQQQVFSPPPPQPVETAPAPGTASALPQPQTFDPDSAPPDPPPPPALEHPGPMEPPSMAHNGPPAGMQGGPDSQ